MTRCTIEDFTYRTIAGDGGVKLNVAIGGQGPAVVLLHGFPQTHYMWRHVARTLADDHTVIVPDLRGYGASDQPLADNPESYSKRTMANDIIAVAREIGFDHFGLVGHDRGALVAVRAGLDHPDAVDFLGILDVLPTMDTWAVLQGVNAKVAWHLYLMAQPAGMPEKMIAAVAPEFFGSFLDAWDPTGTTFTTEERDHYVTSSINSIDSIVADYRATAGIDLDMDLADRERGARLTMPVAVISQDWGSQLGFDASALWRAWAPDFTYQATTSGHFMAEENPDEIAGFITELAARTPAEQP
ncbi:alpha/beta fold hydrolase [Rhodococcus rhodochrous]|uniref:alpha/beta fold hydrolase n=1 Tax=Rhodococcus rhodochrous TaxID=1829 RepID=UPI0023F713D4